MARKNVIANRYEVIEHIGQGGMADVFKAVDTILSRNVAIKILRADLSNDTVSLMRFEREAQAATALAHPNIVEIYDVGDYKGHHYIVMEYVPGRTLKNVIRARGPLVKEEAVDIMRQLVSAVGEAHSKGIIHRDIKPQNVIVKADGTVKILDFGIATAKGSMQLTQTNNVMGSVHYLAPELSQGKGASAQSDIYALGVVLYEMLSKEVPFKADSAIQVALMHLREPFPDVRAKNADVPQALANIITRATAKDPAKRYRSCDEMLRDLSTCLRPEREEEKPLVLNEPEKKKPRQTEKKTAVPEKKPEKKEVEVKEEKNEKKPDLHTRRMNILLGISVTVLVLAGIYFALVFAGVIHLGPRMVQVPDLIGMTITEAKEECAEYNLKLDPEVAYILTDSVEKGKIISSEPDTGSEIEEDSFVRITVSSGIGITVNDYTGMNIREAQEDLAQYPLLQINIKDEPSEAPSGTVIRQEQLQPRDKFDPSSPAQITLVYSSYPTVIIPGEIMGMDVADAIVYLENIGISAVASVHDTSGMSEEQREMLEFGVVVECSPAAGSEYTQKEDNYVILYYY
ncbi:MAG: Stk1 family PASTA domain-containing Ser/Thr kinase [Solobacterium sp.]|nr:Stk1 family PASTA domain-containing Ser/Thr kinase [Solobacterium sp.]